MSPGIRRSGKNTYIYAQARGNDMKLLLVSVEPDEAVVMQLKVDPDKLNAFINEHTSESHRHHDK
ncbi:MAG TPA: hypothetical protein VEI73_10780 [Candidatus Acidoferrum sp.]|nr:hypothetical protein [Candidatus Acidoferrum sp.]